MPRLIVNADDFGLTAGVNRGIQHVFAAGGLTSATLMAGAQEAAAAAAFARDSPGLGVGCHIVLLDGTPVTPPATIASLLKPGTQAFYPTLGEFLRALFVGKILRQHMQAEAAAQLKRLQSLGIQPTHVDTHKHTHMFPPVLEAVLGAAAGAGVNVVRNPMEPAWAVAATLGASRVRKMEVTTLRTLYQQRFLETVRRRGFVTTDGAIGVAATGTLNEASLRNLLQALPDGTWELVCHPGYIDDAIAKIHTKLRQSREVEAACLMQLPSVLKPDTGLIHFGDLTA
jgi:predicted glycoside hydrolase/deacetylase ChbG (UPF0249 family)